MTRFVRLAVVAALIFPFAAHAQTADRPDRAEQRITRLSERLGLTDAQVALVRESLEDAREADGARRHRGASWALAAQLAPTMTEAQLDALRSQMEARAEERRQRRAERAEQGDRPADGRRQRGERSDARADALGLSDAQKQALAERREQRRAERADHRDELAEILTEEQEAILLVHRALSPERGARGHRGGPRGMRRGRR